MPENRDRAIERLILETALISPKAALMQLTIEVDRELRKLLASTGLLNLYLASDAPTLPNGLRLLNSRGTVPKELENKINEFWSLRNRFAHKEGDIPVITFDLGLSIFRILRNIPRPSYIVKKANVELYSDQNCRVLRPNVKGVLVETFDANGKSQGIHIHPSTRQYVEGMSVGWEWDTSPYYRPEMGWDETWYKDPETGKCTPAWSESMEFIGRDIDQI